MPTWILLFASGCHPDEGWDLAETSEAKEEYPGPGEGRAAEEHVGVAENSLGPESNVLIITS